MTTNKRNRSKAARTIKAIPADAATSPTLERFSAVKPSNHRYTDDEYLQSLTDQQLADFLANPPTRADKEAAQSEKARRWAKAETQKVIDELGREAALRQFELDLFGDSRPLSER